MVRYIIIIFFLHQPVPVVRLCAGFFIELLTNQKYYNYGN
jgi:hypothetical protein